MRIEFKEKIVEYLQKYMSSDSYLLNQLSYCVEDDGRNEEDVVKDLFYSKNLRELISRILCNNPIEKKLYLSFDGLEYIKNRQILNCYKHVEDFSLDEYKYVLYCENAELYNDGGGENILVKDMYNVECKVEVNNDNTKIIANIFFNENDYCCRNIIDNEGTYIKCFVYGIRSKTYVPHWCVLLLESLTIYEMGNKETAYHKAYAGFENFINEQYEKLYKTYLSFYLNSKSILDKIYCKLKMNKYKSVKKPLIIFKLKSNLNELGVPKHNYKKKFRRIQKLEKGRNIGAHGGIGFNEESYKYNELVYLIFSFLFLITYVDNDITYILDYE